MRIFEESNPDWLYMKLHMFKRGLVSAKELTDDLISDVRDNGIITLRFESDTEYFKLFDLPEDDINFLTSLFNPYNNFELFDYYRAEEDWKDGYIVRYFSDENMELLEKLKNIIAPDVDIQADKEKISKVLNDLFSKQVDYIVGEYETEMDTAMRGSIEESVKDELCNIFMTDGIHSITGCFYKYMTSVDALIKLYDNHNSKGSDLYDLLKIVGHNKSVNDNYYESMYEYMYTVDFDTKSFNNTVTYQLERIMEELEDSEKFIDVNGYKDTVTYITKKYKMGTWYDLPKDKKIMFKVIRVNPEDNRIELEYKPKGTMDFKKGSVDLEQFNLFLHHPTLF